MAKAAEKFRFEIKKRAASILSRPANELELVVDGVVHRLSGREITLKELAQTVREKNDKIEATFIYIAPKTFALADVEGRKSVSPEEYRNYPSYAYTSQVAAIEVDPGEDGGRPMDKFVGMEEPQRRQIGTPGSAYVLVTPKLGSLSRGTPVKFRGINVGSVTGHKLADDYSHVEIEIFVDAPYDKHINSGTRFWDVSGLDVNIGADGITLEMDSLASLLAGGIASISGISVSYKAKTVFSFA